MVLFLLVARPLRRREALPVRGGDALEEANAEADAGETRRPVRPGNRQRPGRHARREGRQRDRRRSDRPGGGSSIDGSHLRLTAVAAATRSPSSADAPRARSARTSTRAGRQGRDLHPDLDRGSERVCREGLSGRDDAAATTAISSPPSRSTRSSSSCRRPPATDRSAASRVATLSAMETTGPGAAKRFHVTTFGCQMNEHDSERMKGMLGSWATRRPAAARRPT